MPRGGGERGALLAVGSPASPPRAGYGSASKPAAKTTPRSTSPRRRPPATGLDVFHAQRARLGEPLSSPPGTRTTDDLGAFPIMADAAGALSPGADELRAPLVDADASAGAATQQRQADSRFRLIKVVSTAMLVVSYIILAVRRAPPRWGGRGGRCAAAPRG